MDARIAYCHLIILLGVVFMIQYIIVSHFSLIGTSVWDQGTNEHQTMTFGMDAQHIQGREKEIKQVMEGSCIGVARRTIHNVINISLFIMCRL